MCLYPWPSRQGSGTDGWLHTRGGRLVLTDPGYKPNLRGPWASCTLKRGSHRRQNVFNAAFYRSPDTKAGLAGLKMGPWAQGGRKRGWRLGSSARQGVQVRDASIGVGLAPKEQVECARRINVSHAQNGFVQGHPVNPAQTGGSPGLPWVLGTPQWLSGLSVTFCPWGKQTAWVCGSGLGQRTGV